MKKMLLCAAAALALVVGAACAEDEALRYTINYNYTKELIQTDDFTVYIPSIFEDSYLEDVFIGYTIDDCKIEVKETEYVENSEVQTKEEWSDGFQKELAKLDYTFTSRDVIGFPVVVLMSYEKGYIWGVGNFDVYTEANVYIFLEHSFLDVVISTPDEEKAATFTDGILAHIEAAQ